MIHSADDFTKLASTVETIIVDNNVCNDPSFSRLDLQPFSCLKALEVGNYSCCYVDEVLLVGLKKLERVEVGVFSFGKMKNRLAIPLVLNRRFALRDCERMKELKVGRGSFYDYFLFEVENVPSLEVIDMGDWKEDGAVFYWASLTLRSMVSWAVSSIDLLGLKTLRLGREAFWDCHRAVFESGGFVGG